MNNRTTNHATSVTGNRFVTPDLLQDTHFARLLSRHNELEDKLAEEMNHPLVDWDGVKLIKRRKLAVTEELAKLRRERGLH